MILGGSEVNMEVGEYIRTKEGYIGFYVKNEENFIVWDDGINNYWTTQGNIVNHSKNIIDLIEVRRLCEWA